MPLPPTFPVRLVASHSLTPAVRELIFERENGPFEFAPGQWVSLAMPTGPDPAKPLRRSYSIASAPDGTARFALAITLVDGGPGSSFLHEIEPGTSLQATGPQGFFSRPADLGTPSLFVATGTGVTPLRSMLHAALARGAAEPLWLLLGTRHEAGLVYREELEALAARHPNVRVFFTLSRPEEGWTGLSGYVQSHVPALWDQLVAVGGAGAHLYICGLERMVREVRDVGRKQLGLGRDQVRSERFD
jgi:ferredoxin-NADP reductase